MENPLIALLTDFGDGDFFVGSLKAIIAVESRVVRSFRTAYDSPKPFKPFAFVNCLGLLEVAVRQGSAAQVLGAPTGSPVTVWGEGPR
jgi:S-adenosylmethionine hydrolase